MGNAAGTRALAGLAAGPGPGEWTVRRDADIRAVLADPRFTVLPPGPGGPPGTVAWLRASVSRFATGAQHARRRALAESELRRLDPGALRSIARELAAAQLARRGRGRPAGVTGALARLVPPAALATALGAAAPVRVSAAVSTVAAAYFPGAGLGQEQRADRATAWLLTALRPAGPAGAAGADLAVARITLLVQACEATAALIGAALDLLPEAPAAGAGGPAQALLAEALRRRPPVRAIRRVAGERVAGEPAGAGGGVVQPGDRVTCDVEAAARDPAAAGRAAAASLAFGAGIRPCPGPAQALALAAGVIDAVRERGVS
jgi:cytochrome P450